MDPHRFDADLDPAFHFDAVPDPDPSQVLHMLADYLFCFNFYSQQCQFTLFYLSPQRHSWHNFQHFGITYVSRKTIGLLYIWLK
jgi:hypothetical protein